MTTTECLPHQRFEFHKNLPLEVSYDAPHISSDGGLILLRLVDDQIGLCAGLAALLPDKRNADRVVHSRQEQLRQRVFQIAAGYEDQNDASTLRKDPLLRAVCDRLPNDARGLSSQPTLSRLEHSISARTVVAMQRKLESDYVDSLSDDTTCVVLDVDGTSDPTHGQQPLAFFQGHYDCWMYFPLLVFDGEGRLVSVRLRPGNSGNCRYAPPLISRLVRKIKARFPNAEVVVRADSGFCHPRFLSTLDTLNSELGGVDYVIGMAKHPKLVGLIEKDLANVTYQCAENPGRMFIPMTYQTNAWKTARYVVAKLEKLGDKANPRFVVTTLSHVPPRMVYEQAYCQRGASENRIKDFKNALGGDRLSCTTYVANAFRLILHSMAYRLVDALRAHVALESPSLANAQFDTIRLRLIKVAAHVRQSVRRIAVALPVSFPDAVTFFNVSAALAAFKLAA